MQAIRRKQLERMIEHHEPFALIDVLGREEYREFHLPGAINVPNTEHFAEEIERAVPDKHLPVVVYCQDVRSDASPKAARKLEALGYDHVYHYEAGKSDWKQAGLPIEG